MNIDEHFPKLSQLELAVAINACKEAGAANAATALSKYISRLEIQITQLEKEVKAFKEKGRPEPRMWIPDSDAGN